MKSVRINLNLSLLLCVLLLAACKQIATSNGEVPANYVELVKNYVADYKGAMDLNQGVLSLSFEAAKFRAHFKGKVNDITGNEKCQSQIGDLISIQVNDSGSILESATFGFSPNHCPEIKGNSLELIFTPIGLKLGVSAIILRETKELQICQDIQGANGAPNCHPDLQNFYFTGIFEKP